MEGTVDLNTYYITINPLGLTGAPARRYQEQVHEHLRWIHRTISGAILLNCIRRPNFPIEIRPHPLAECNATGGGEAKPVGAGYRGFVTYTPGYFGHSGVCAASDGANTSGRIFDEILFHELVHVFRNATGMWNQSPLLGWGMRQYDDNEEFIAVLCTNIYLSDRSNKIKSGLRDGHRGYGAMSTADAGRFRLFINSASALPLIKQFCADNPIFTKALSDKLPNIDYNPIADFLRFPALCEACSIFGKYNDRKKFDDFLRANGVMAAVVQQLTNPLRVPGK